MPSSRSPRVVLLFLCLTSTLNAADTVLRRAVNTAPAISGPTFTLSLTGVDSFLGVAATAGSGVAGSASGDLFLRTNQRVLISTNGGASAGLAIDPAGNLTASGSMTAASFVGSVSSFSGPLAGDVTGSQGATQVAFVGGQSAANVASGAQAANAATEMNTAYAIVKRDRTGEIAVGSIRFADGSVLSSAPSLRRFYLTKTEFTAAQATTACEAGFHMASIWEVVNLSTLSYDTSRGLTMPDSGSGPPAYPPGGWIRTGWGALQSISAGSADCGAWTSNATTEYGTFVYLPHYWVFDSSNPSSGSYIAPWVGSVAPCSNPHAVWCLQN